MLGEDWFSSLRSHRLPVVLHLGVGPWEISSLHIGVPDGIGTVKVLFRLQKLVKDLIRMTSKKLTLLEENRQYTVRNRIRKDLVNRNPFAQELRPTIDEVRLYNTKTFLDPKGNNQVNRDPIEWEKNPCQL